MIKTLHILKAQREKAYHNERGIANLRRLSDLVLL